MATLAILFGLTAALAADSPATPQHVDQVVVVFKTHYDIGYTDLASKVVETYRTTMIDKALDVCDQSRSLPRDQRFVWTIPGWPMAKILEEPQDATRRARVLDALKHGSFITHALPFTTHTESLELEDLVRGLGFSSRVARMAELPLPRDAKMTDVPSHSWVMPTLLKHAGVEFIHMGCNSANRGPELPPVFWWEGPDGSRVLTMYSVEYGTGLVPPQDWPHRTWLALIHTGDNQGPPKPEQITGLVDEAKLKLPGVPVKFGRLSDFADALIKEKAEIPVIRGDLPDTWIHGVMSMPMESGLARRVRPQLATVETLHTLLGLWGIEQPGISHDLAKAYEQSLLFGEHTWGFDAKRFPRLYGDEWKQKYAEGAYKDLEASWQEKGRYVCTMWDLVKPALAQRMDALAKAVKSDAPRIVVFNPLPWPVDAQVLITLAERPEGRLIDAETREELPCEAARTSVRFLARNVPATGYRTYVFDAAAPSAAAALAVDETTNCFENGVLRVTLDLKRGCIASLIETATGRELVDTSSTYGVGQYLYERFSQTETHAYFEAYSKSQADWAVGDFDKPGLLPPDQAPYRSAAPQNWSVRYSRDATFVSAIMRSEPTPEVPYSVKIAVTLPKDRPYVDVTCTITNKPADPWPEAGWLCVPMSVAQPRFLLGRLGGTVDPAKDVVYGANHDMYCLNTGMAVLDATGAGVALCPLDSPLVSLERPGLWRYSKDFQPKTATAFVNLYNNQWSTNFQQWVGGTLTSRVRVWAVTPGEPEGAWVSRSWEARMPLLAAFANGPGGGLPFSRPGVQLSREGILLTAFGPNPDGKGRVLRLWEQTGLGGPCTVTLPEGCEKVSHVQPCDLRGQNVGKRIGVTKGKFDTEMNAYAPASFLLMD
ncbi:MAG: hypothetical protein WC655_08475 [Candidatus Hydrogenedentales bacterium]|jgi:hypothetical protein